MLKKVSFKNSRQLNLIGSLYSASSNAIVIMAHGATSNRLWGGKFEKISQAEAAATAQKNLCKAICIGLHRFF